MDCPNCNKEMKDKSRSVIIPDFSGTADDWELEGWHEEHSCKQCKITYNCGSWIIPDDLQPSDKQKKTILFIENRIGYKGESLTKRQAWNIINKYFDKAKKNPFYSDNYYVDLQEAYGMDASDFC